MSYIEESVAHEELKKALILAGMREIEQKGIVGLSLRRIATKCGVSCAAPYRHFENKERLVFAIISYVNSQWEILKDSICTAFKDDEKKMLLEICAATVLFWRANNNFRSVIMLDDKFLDAEQIKEKNRITDEICDMVKRTCQNSEKKAFMVKSVLYGAAADQMADINLIKDCLLTILAS